MIQEDKQRFAMAVGEAAIMFSKDMTKEHISILWKNLIEFDIDQIESAFNEHIKIGKKFPVTADIRELIPEKSAKTWKKGDMVLIGGNMRKVLN